MAGYAIISVGGKQYRVQEGQKLLVDRVTTDEGKTFHPSVLMLGGDGKTDLTPQGVSVTARVVAHVKGEKVRIGKYRKRTGYRRHTGFRASLTQLEIERIGAGKAAPPKAAAPKAEAPAPAPAKAEAPPKAQERPAGMPKGYEEMTVAQIAEAASGWRRPMLEAALTYERDHGARKGAIGALEHALAAKEEKH
jgi:large subunit ribosomal protein L21